MYACHFLHISESLKLEQECYATSSFVDWGVQVCAKVFVCGHVFTVSSERSICNICK